MEQCEVLTPEGVESLVTATEAAQLCGVAPVTIRKWQAVGYTARNGQQQRLPVAGRDRQGRNLYRQIDVAKAEFATRVRARRG